MPVTVRVKKGRTMTIRHIEHDQTQALSQRDFSAERPSERPPQRFQKSKKRFSVKKTRPIKDPYTEGNRVKEIKRLDAKGKLTPEQRIERLMELAGRHGPEYLENELQIHKRKVVELEEALSQHKSMLVAALLMDEKLADKVEKELNPQETK